MDQQLSVEEMFLKILSEIQRIPRIGSADTALTFKQAAKRLNRSPATVTGMVKSGFLQMVRIGRSRMIPTSEIDRILRPIPAPAAKRGGGRSGRRQYEPRSDAALIRSTP